MAAVGLLVPKVNVKLMAADSWTGDYRSVECRTGTIGQYPPLTNGRYLEV
jgi:hypothetical protein